MLCVAKSCVNVVTGMKCTVRSVQSTLGDPLDLSVKTQSVMSRSFSLSLSLRA